MSPLPKARCSAISRFWDFAVIRTPKHHRLWNRQLRAPSLGLNSISQGIDASLCPLAVYARGLPAEECSVAWSCSQSLRAERSPPSELLLGSLLLPASHGVYLSAPPIPQHTQLSDPARPLPRPTASQWVAR
eukprot:15485361-Alexandrium_andersonii.AAC.5